MLIILSARQIKYAHDRGVVWKDTQETITFIDLTAKNMKHIAHQNDFEILTYKFSISQTDFSLQELQQLQSSILLLDKNDKK
jgi:hypothetical protein